VPVFQSLVAVAASTDSFVEVSGRQIPKVPALRGKTVVWLFYEDSTRTRLSFEQAAKRLSADTMNFSVGSSSVNKGESLRDTVQTIEAMGVDCIVVRHGSAGAPWRVADWVDASVVNAGDGWHEHPTQALLDCYTVRQHLGGLEGRRIAIVGDIKHSRVARSDVLAFTALGAEVTLVAPPTLLPVGIEAWPCRVGDALEDELPGLDAVMMLRVQAERMHGAQRGRRLHRRLALVALDLVGDAKLLQHPQDALRARIVEMVDDDHRIDLSARDSSSVVTKALNASDLLSPEPRNGSAAKRSGLSEKILFADFDAAVPENVVSGRRMEI
jgi:aspartate carbamoyltransferase catalytic subunit